MHGTVCLAAGDWRQGANGVVYRPIGPSLPMAQVTRTLVASREHLGGPRSRHLVKSRVWLWNHLRTNTADISHERPLPKATNAGGLIAMTARRSRARWL